VGQVNSSSVRALARLVRHGAMVLTVGAPAWWADASQGVTGQYRDLAATFDGSTGVLDIFAVDLPTLHSAGIVRELGGPHSAVFSSGFVSEPNPASFEASLHVTNIGDGLADVSGTVTVTDVDGDTITMGVEHYVLLFGEADGSVTGVTTWLAIESDEALFDGTDGGQVSTDFPLQSATLVLSIVRNPREGSGLFHTSFDDGRASSMFVIPAPGGAIVLLAAGAACVRRRRAV
jgi:hypothetical protein